MTSGQMVLYNTPYTIRKYNMDKYDQPEYLLATENDNFQKQCAMYQSYALMCLMTPIEVFDPFFSYSILKKFPQRVHDEAVRKMHKKGILVKRRGERALPGTLMSLAAKFFNVMVGQLPDNIFKQAVEYDKFLSSKDSKVHFSSEFVSSGMMACVLNLLSENKLSITFTYPEREILRMESLPMKLRSIGKQYQSLVSMEIDIEKVKKDDDEFMPYVPPINKLNLKRLNAEEYKDVLSNFLLSQDEFFSVLAVKIVDLLYKEKEYGLSLYQIKTRLEDFYTDKDITLLLERLCLNNPALVSRVGFNIVRYVHIDFIDQWAIINKNISVHSISEKTKERMTKTSAIIDTPMKRKEVVVPCLWTDVNGHSTDLIFKGCKEAIVDLVLRKPGIMEADIYRHLSLGLTRNEVLRLLTDLVEQGVLKQTQIVISFDHQSKPSIFKKRLPFRCTNNIAIEKTALTCFWVTPSYYTL
ncbi:MAG: hypothetical protein EXX96DRAFT_372624 [Benjaminiella poitrasii]|nr:MAG: hypothetical protein EXX96DRAFT_372624 [Benjaminiella poitrasii]